MTSALAQARAYLATLPAGISGAGGHPATFRAACECVRFGLGDADALALLREFNRRCRPPWTEKELAHKLKDARRVASGSARILAPRPAVRFVWPTAPRKPAQPEKVAPLPPAEPVPTPLPPCPEVLPYFTIGGTLVVPFASPARFHYWKKRTEADGVLTLAEVRQTAFTE